MTARHGNSRGCALPAACAVHGGHHVCGDTFAFVTAEFDAERVQVDTHKKTFWWVEESFDQAVT